MPKSRWLEPPPPYSTFASDLKRLGKKFPKIQGDLEDIKSHLSEHAGEREGPWHSQIPGAENVWKIRWGNTSKRTGKSGGFRLIYLLDHGRVFPCRMYDKGEEEVLPNSEQDQNLEDLRDAIDAAEKDPAR